LGNRGGKLHDVVLGFITVIDGELFWFVGLVDKGECYSVGMQVI
jgi:hypothetical protein